MPSPSAQSEGPGLGRAGANSYRKKARGPPVVGGGPPPLGLAQRPGFDIPRSGVVGSRPRSRSFGMGAEQAESWEQPALPCFPDSSSAPFPLLLSHLPDALS